MATCSISKIGGEDDHTAATKISCVMRLGHLKPKPITPRAVAIPRGCGAIENGTADRSSTVKGDDIGMAKAKQLLLERLILPSVRSDIFPRPSQDCSRNA